jgi:hypothetical protein
MFNPLAQYRVMRGSGLSRLGALWFVALLVMMWPFIALSEWATPEAKGFGKMLLHVLNEPPPTPEETEQYHEDKMKSECGIFDEDTDDSR